MFRSAFDSVLDHPFVAMIALVVVAVAGMAIIHFATLGTSTFTINKMERVEKSSGQGSEYLIFTDNGVFKNTDSIFALKFNSSDLYNQLEEGATYTCKTTGFRLGIGSQYKNLLSCETAEQLNESYILGGSGKIPEPLLVHRLKSKNSKITLKADALKRQPLIHKLLLVQNN